MILVMPSDGLWGIGSGYLDRVTEDAEGWIVEDVLQVAQHVYPDADHKRVNVVGLSMGGWGALRLAAQYPDRIGRVSALSPLTKMSQLLSFFPSQVDARPLQQIAVEDLGDVLTTAAGSLPPLRIVCGRDDELLPSVRALSALLRAAGIAHEYEESDGGHDWAFWRNELRRTLQFLSVRDVP